MTHERKLRTAANGNDPLPWWPAWPARWTSDRMRKLSATQQAVYFQCMSLACESPQPEGRPKSTRLVLDRSGDPVPPKAIAALIGGTKARHIYTAIRDLVTKGWLSVRPREDLAGSCVGPERYLAGSWDGPEIDVVLVVENYANVVEGLSTERSAKSKAKTAGTETNTYTKKNTYTLTERSEPEPERAPPAEDRRVEVIEAPHPEAVAEPASPEDHDGLWSGLLRVGHDEADALVSALRAAQERMGITDRYRDQQHKIATEFLASHSLHDGMKAIDAREREYRRNREKTDTCFLNAFGCWRMFDERLASKVERQRGHWFDLGDEILWTSDDDPWWSPKDGTPNAVHYATDFDDSNTKLSVGSHGVHMKTEDRGIVAHNDRIWRMVLDGRLRVDSFRFGWGYDKHDGVTPPSVSGQTWVATIYPAKGDGQDTRSVPQWAIDKLREQGRLTTYAESLDCNYGAIEAVVTPAEAKRDWDAGIAGFEAMIEQMRSGGDKCKTSAPAATTRSAT